jgi:hypothetical protein
VRAAGPDATAVSPVSSLEENAERLIPTRHAFVSGAVQVNSALVVAASACTSSIVCGGMMLHIQFMQFRAALLLTVEQPVSEFQFR